MAENKTVKQKRRLNVVDFLIILIVLGAIVGLIFRSGFITKVVNKSLSEPVKVEILIENVQQATRDVLKPGDEFYDKTNKNKFGTLKEVISSTPSELVVSGLNGQLYNAGSVERVDMRCAFECEGVKTDEGFLLNGVTYLAPNMTVELWGTANCTVTIINIEGID